ncbi:HVO_0476 family zinc finger protein [Methanothermococcus thermolithotrophicus]|jgi:uncharacterized Zn finger protein|uniref:HVO_0476 family zinc finger protein n=1 Tax=Methanothermococcus thermolithotrophicus TaxID=2186 RepID=UPI000379CDBC|nr:HVO_0476 family zinc finger protein [Methanothermococcus thermolithotrophicus]MDK2988158.1 hypothetical protein [Methanothermococcus sp.]
MEEKFLLECPSCDDVTPHDILKKVESKKHVKYTVKCLDCGHVHEVEKTVKLKDVKIIISRFDESEKKVIQVPTNEILSVGDKIEVFGENVEITGIETDKRVTSSKAESVKTLWAKSIDIPKKVGISINNRGITYSINILVPQDYVFEEGKVYKIKSSFFRIKMIKTEKGNFKREVARKIKRIYADSTKPLRKHEDLTDYLI